MPSVPSLDRAAVRRLLADVRRTRVLVVGDIMLDRYLVGDVARISPEAPVPVLHQRHLRRALGGAANVAAGIQALGGSSRLVGVIGEDGAGDALAELLRRLGIPAEQLVADPRRPTTVKTRVLARQQQMLRIDREVTSPLEEGTADRLLARALEALPWAKVLVLEDYNKGALDPDRAGRLLAAARDQGLPSIVDPKLRHFFEFRGATVFKPNARELAAALGLERAPTTAEALRPVVARLECGNLLVTMGEAGMLLLESGAGEPIMIPSHAREVYDVSGAGDTVTAVLAVALAAAAPLREAATLANFAAGLEVTRLGARPVSWRELLSALDPGGLGDVEEASSSMDDGERGL